MKNFLIVLAICFGVKGYSQASVEFEQSNSEFIAISERSAYDFGTGDFTVEAKIAASPNQNTTFPMIFSMRGPFTEITGFFVSLSQQGGESNVLVQLDGTNYSTSGLTLNDGSCYHIAVTRISGVVTVYVNGNDSYEIATAANQDVTAGPFGAIIIGNDQRNNFVNGMNGEISEVRLWNTGRSQSEIINNIDQDITNPENETSLVGYWKMNEGSGQTVGDSSSVNNNGIFGDNSGTANDPSWQLNPACDTLLSLQENNSIEDVALYPNPVIKELFINTPNNAIYAFKIYTIDGKQVLDGKTDGRINVERLSSGTYVLQLNAGDGGKTIKFMRD